MNLSSEEEDPDEYPFPLTLRTKRSGPASPLDGVTLNGGA
jgi:glycogen synthase